MKRALKIVLRIAIITFVIVVMVVVGGIAGVLYTRWAKDNREIITPSGDIQLKDPDGAQIVLEEKVTCLFMGVNGALTDFIMLGQYNPNTREVNLMSIPRDTKVEGTVDGKINSAYAGVDPMRTVNKVEELTGVDIDYYVLFKTKVVREIVDAVGGVTVDVPMDMNYDDPAQDLYIHLKKGVQKLTGKQAEQFCRFRKGYANADLGRIQAQQSFIKALISRCLEPQNLLKIGTLIDIVLENTKTNITMDIASGYIDDVVAFKPDRVRMETLPGKSGTINHLSYFLVNEEEAKALIQDVFFKDRMGNVESGDTIITESGEVEVIQCGADSKDFLNTVNLLNQEGFSVVKVSQGEEVETSKIIVDSEETKEKKWILALSELLEISTIEVQENESGEQASKIVMVQLGKDR